MHTVSAGHANDKIDMATDDRQAAHSHVHDGSPVRGLTRRNEDECKEQSRMRRQRRSPSDEPGQEEYRRQDTCRDDESDDAEGQDSLRMRSDGHGCLLYVVIAALILFLPRIRLGAPAAELPVIAAPLNLTEQWLEAVGIYISVGDSIQNATSILNESVFLEAHMAVNSYCKSLDAALRDDMDANGFQDGAPNEDVEKSDDEPPFISRIRALKKQLERNCTVAREYFPDATIAAASLEIKVHGSWHGNVVFTINSIAEALQQAAQLDSDCQVKEVASHLHEVDEEDEGGTHVDQITWRQVQALNASANDLLDSLVHGMKYLDPSYSPKNHAHLKYIQHVLDSTSAALTVADNLPSLSFPEEDSRDNSAVSTNSFLLQRQDAATTRGMNRSWEFARSSEAKMKSTLDDYRPIPIFLRQQLHNYDTAQKLSSEIKSKVVSLQRGQQWEDTVFVEIPATGLGPDLVWRDDEGVDDQDAKRPGMNLTLRRRWYSPQLQAQCKLLVDTAKIYDVVRLERREIMKNRVIKARDKLNMWHSETWKYCDQAMENLGIPQQYSDSVCQFLTTWKWRD